MSVGEIDDQAKAIEYEIAFHSWVTKPLITASCCSNGIGLRHLSGFTCRCTIHRTDRMACLAR
jgi:hypothetical protein